LNLSGEHRELMSSPMALSNLCIFLGTKRVPRASAVRRQRWAIVTFAGAVAMLSGCAFQNHRLEMANLAAGGQYAQAAAVLDNPGTQDLYGDNSKLIWLLDRGSIAFATGDDQQAFACWEEADKIMDLWREQPPGQTVASWLFNDEVTTYIASPYEDIYVNAMKLLVNLRLGRVQGGATVEARRAASKANVLRDRYLKYDSAIAAKEGQRYQQAKASLPRDAMFADATSGGQFVESTLATYLSALTFAKVGDSSSQAVAGRRLEEIISAQGSLIGQVSASDFSAMQTITADQASVLLVAFSGRGPIKVPIRIGPIPIYTYPLYVELPRLQTFNSEVRSVRAVAEPVGGSSADGISVSMPLIEDMGRVAAVNFQRELPQIYARSIIRASIKSAASTVLTESVRRNNRRGDGDLVAIGLTLAGLAFVAATERADLRCWAFLPGQAHVQVLNLPQGEWTVRMDYLSGGGGVVYSTRPEQVTVTGDSSALPTIVGVFWR